MKLLLLLQVASLCSSEVLSGLRAVDRTDLFNVRPQCVFHFEGLNGSIEGPEVYIAITCDKEVLVNTTIWLSEAAERQTSIEGITIFSEAAYLSIQNAAMFDMQGSVFMNLTPLPRALGGSVAPVVINNMKMGISNSVMSGNVGFDISGGMIVTGNSNVTIKASNFTDCQGGKAGVIVMDEDATVRADKCHFRKNSGMSLAGSISASGSSILRLYTCNFDGGSEDILGWKAYGDPVVFMSSSPKAGAIALQDTATGKIDGCIFSNHSGTHGTVYAAHQSTLTLTKSVFQENFIAFGGGIFVDGQIRQATQVRGCTFEGNSAQFGGALVVLGATSFLVEECAFLFNRATKSGGAFYFDFTHPNATDYTACSKTSEGSMILVDLSKFLSNIAEGSGGAIYSKCTRLVANKTMFDHNSAGGYGGGVFIDTGLEFDTDLSKFTGNSAGKGGSAIYALETTTLNATSSLFKGNSVHGTIKGGTIAAHVVSHVILLHLTVEDNTSMRGSAGLEVEGAEQVDIIKCTMTRNSGANGGAFAGINVMKVTIQDTTVQENEASGGGAFVLSKVPHAAIQSSKFSRNQAKLMDGGGLILTDSGSVTIDDVTFEENVARVSCGAIKIDVAEKVEILKGLFLSNTGTSGLGGAVCIHKVDLFSTDPYTNLTSNTCANGGGALNILSCKSLSIQGTTFLQNRARAGAAVAANDIKRFMLKNVTSLKNYASVGGIIDAKNVESFQAGDGLIQDNKGSGIRLLLGNSALVSGIKIVGNTAESGGGLVLSRCAKVEVRNVILTDNKAMEDAGAIYSDGISEFTVVNTVMTGNIASREGGAIIVIGNSNTTISNSSLNRNEAADSGGGFVCEAKSMVYVNASTFSYNYARNGQSIAAKCDCQVSISGSVFNRDAKRKKNGDFFKWSKKCATISHTSSFFAGAPTRGLAWWWILLIVLLCLSALSLCLLCFLCFAPESWQPHMKTMMLMRLKQRSSTPDIEAEAIPLVYDDEVDDIDATIVSHPINIHGEIIPEIEELPVAGPSGNVRS